MSSTLIYHLDNIFMVIARFRTLILAIAMATNQKETLPCIKAITIMGATT